VASDLVAWLEDKGMEHVRCAPYHPQMQGKIERWHQTLKNRILLDNYYLPRDLEQQINAFVEHYNHVRFTRASTTSRPLTRKSRDDPRPTTPHQAGHNRKPPLAASTAGRLDFNP
jgi:hypothetical protein